MDGLQKMKIIVKVICFIYTHINKLTYTLKIQDGGHLGKTSKLVTNRPRGDRRQITDKGTQLLVKLETTKLQKHQ